jgi:hypothetical protein
MWRGIENNCADYAEAVPACANTTWSMYSFGDPFCCLPGQVGLARPGQAISGSCVDKDVAVPATELASTVCLALAIPPL